VDQILADESVELLTSAGDILWPLTDHLNTTRDLAEYNAGSDTASIASHRVFDSFGNLISETNGSVTILFGFTARPFDVASGLQWNLNRWYVSTLGVWMSEDPIGFEAGDASLRRYVANSTLDSIDPVGLNRWIIFRNGHYFILVEVWNTEGTEVIGYTQLHFSIVGHSISGGYPGWGPIAIQGYQSSPAQDMALIRSWIKQGDHEIPHDPFNYFYKGTCYGESFQRAKHSEQVRNPGDYEAYIHGSGDVLPTITSESPRREGVHAPPQLFEMDPNDPRLYVGQ
jgi:RHS repeat-associated protein